MAKIRTISVPGAGKLHIDTGLPVSLEPEIVSAFASFARAGFPGELIITAHGPSTERVHGRFVLRHDLLYRDTFAIAPQKLRTTRQHTKSRSRTPRKGRR